MSRAYLIAALASCWLVLTGCGGSSGSAAGPTITFVSNDTYEVESTGSSFIPAATGVLSNDPGATVVLGSDTSTAAGGTVVVNSDGSFTYTPPSPAPATDSFGFRSEYANTGSTAVLDGTVRLLVGTFNPTSGTLPVNVLEETTSGVQSAPGMDPNAVPITFSVSVGPTQAASFTFLPDGTFGYTPNVDFSGVDTFQYLVTNSNGRTSPPGVVTITVQDINDQPSVTVASNPAVNDGTVVNTPGFATFVVGPPSEVGVQTVTGAPVTCNNLTLFTTAPAIDPATGNLSMETAPGMAGVSNCSVTIQDSGGTTNGGVDTSAAVAFDVTVTDVKSPPVVTPPPGPYPFLGNTTLSVPVGSGLLANFADPGDSPPDTIHPTVPFVITSAPAGTLTTAADGSFDYTPVAGSRADDSFTYVVRDNGGVNDTSSTITVNLTFNGMVWWVDNSVLGPGSGLQSDPFNTIALAEAVGTRQAGDVFRIRQGTGTDVGYDTGFTLLDGDRVIGEGVALTSGGLTVDAAGAGAPVLSESTSGTNAITLAANNTLAGLTARARTAATNYAIRGAAAGSLVTTAVTIDSQPLGSGIRAEGLGAGTNLDITSLVSTFGEHGIRLEGDTGGTGVATFGASLVQDSTADSVFVDSDLAISFPATPTSLTITNPGTMASGVSVSGLSPTQIAGFSTTGNVSVNGGSGLIASNANVSVANAGTQALVATGGPALSLQNVNVGTANAMTFSVISSTNPPNEGLSINNVEGTVTISSGNIQSPQTASAIAARVNASPATVTLNNLTITSTAQVVTGLFISGATGSPVSVSNLSIDLDVAGSTGLQISGGHPGVTLQTATIDTSTGAGAGTGIDLTGAAGGTYVLEAVTVTTALGTGILAQGGTGSLEIRPTSSVTTTGGRALDIDMPSTGVGIQVDDITATGGDFGVRVQNTSNVRLGPAAPSTTLDSQTINGILLQNVTTAEVRNLVVQNSAGSGIVANGVSDLTVDGVDVIDNGDAVTEHGLSLVNISGTASITASDFLRSGGSNVDLVMNDSLTPPVTLTVTNGTYTQTGAPVSAIDSLHVDVGGGATATVVVTGAAFMNQGTTRDAVFARVDGTSPNAGTLTVSVGASSFATASSAVDLVKDEDAVLTATVENGTFSGCQTDCIRIANPLGSTNTGGSVTASITGNTLGSALTAGSASSAGRGIATIFTGLAAETVTIDNNTVQRSAGAGIAVEGPAGGGLTGVDVTNNTAVSDADDGIRLLVDQTRTICGRVVGNTSTPFAGFSAYLLAEIGGVSNIVLEQTSGVDVATQLAADNTGLPINQTGTPALAITDCVP